jgi:hypothetical protein
VKNIDIMSSTPTTAEQTCWHCHKTPSFFLSLECEHHICMSCAKHALDQTSIPIKQIVLFPCPYCRYGTPMEVETRELLYNYNPNQTSSEEDKNSGPSESENLSSDKNDQIDDAKSSTEQDSPSKKNTKFYHSNPNSIH